MVESDNDGLPADDELNGFEQLGQENGNRFWWQSDLRQLLGYASSDTFQKPVGKAISACTALGIPVQENFRHAERTMPDGSVAADCKMSRFACYLTAMNASPVKPEVARAQAYFATLAEFARRYILDSEHVERILIRDEVTDREASLSHAAFQAGVVNYAFFQNAGYRGLYNMNIAELRSLKLIPAKRTPLDFMGREELAANLFRITQTEAKIRNDGVRGQNALERTAEGVGRQVRETIRKIGGTMPERLQPSEDMRQLKSGFKQTEKALHQIDQKKPKRIRPSKSKPDPEGA